MVMDSWIATRRLLFSTRRTRRTCTTRCFRCSRVSSFAFPQVTLAEKDEDKDGAINLKEFLGEMYDNKQSEWHSVETTRFKEEYDQVAFHLPSLYFMS